MSMRNTIKGILSESKESKEKALECIGVKEEIPFSLDIEVPVTGIISARHYVDENEDPTAAKDYFIEYDVKALAEAISQKILQVIQRQPGMEIPDQDSCKEGVTMGLPCCLQNLPLIEMEKQIGRRPMTEPAAASDAVCEETP